jgi:hypothetical protein
VRTVVRVVGARLSFVKVAPVIYASSLGRSVEEVLAHTRHFSSVNVRV